MCELPSAFWSELRKAKKYHKCCECLGTIKKGEQYYYNRGIWDYEPMSFKECENCHDLRIEVDQDIKDWEEKTPFEGLCESIYECHDKVLIEKFRNIINKRCRIAKRIEHLNNLLKDDNDE
jgi:hypothetical protein